MLVITCIFYSDKRIDEVWRDFIITDVGTVLNIIGAEKLAVSRDDFGRKVGLWVLKLLESRHVSKPFVYNAVKQKEY